MAKKPAPVQPDWIMQAPLWYSGFNGIEHFYDGTLPVENGIIVIPRERTDWVRRMQVNGYSLTTPEQTEAFSKEYNQ